MDSEHAFFDAADLPGDEYVPQETVERILRLISLLATSTCRKEDIFQALSLYYKIDDSDEDSRQKSHQSARQLFKRDLRLLEDLGYEIVRLTSADDRRKNTYHLKEGCGPQLSFLFSSHEVRILSLLYNLFADPRKDLPQALSSPLPFSEPAHPFAEDIVAFVQRLIDQLPKAERHHFYQQSKNPYIFLNMAPVADYRPYRATIDCINVAIQQDRAICFRYRSSQGSASFHHQRVDPYSISNIDGRFYLIGFNHAKKKHFEYRIDRIEQESIEVLEMPIEHDYQQHAISFSYWINENLVRDGLGQRWLSQTILRFSEPAEETSSGMRRALVQATAYSEWRILQQLHKYAHTVELVDPPYLRQRFYHELQQAIQFYEK